MFERVDWTLLPKEDKRLDLSSNVCHDEVLQRLISHLLQRKRGVKYYQYPNEGLTYQTLSDFYGIDVRNIAIGFGLGELIPRIFSLYQDKKFSIVTPTWMMATGFCNVQKINYVEGIDYSADVLYIANPNGMTGKYLDRKTVLRFLDHFKLVIVDEAYEDFCVEGCSVLEYAPKVDNLIVTKTLSKSLSLPGIRFGYCFSNKKLIYKLQQIRPSGVLSNFVPTLGIDLFRLMDGHIERMLQTKRHIHRKYDCEDSHANFVFFKKPERILDEVRYRKIGNLHRMSLMDMHNFRYYEEISKI